MHATISLLWYTVLVLSEILVWSRTGLV